MKKAVILTSIFALAACSGGGGHHSSGGGNPSVPTNNPTFTSGIYTNTENNDNVTQMKTQVIVDTGGHVITPTLTRGGHVRGGSIHDTQGNSYNVYDLEDVEFRVADAVPASLKIGLADDGAIDDITLSVGGVESQLARDGDTNHFRGPIFEYVPDGDDRATFRVADNGQMNMDDLADLATEHNLTGGHWNYIDERMDVTTNKYITEGNENAPVLQYSDFGHFNPVYRSKHTELDADVLAAIRQYGADIEAALSAGDTTAFNTLLATSGLNREDKDKYHDNEEFEEELQKEDYQLFAGGYAIGADGQPIAAGTFDAPTNTTFTGTGVGRVYTSIHANANGTEQGYKNALFEQYGITGDGHDMAKKLTTSSAQLTVDASGNQELVMNFDDFYRVTATKTAGGVEDVVLDNPNNVAIETKYMKNGDVALPDYTSTNPQYQVVSNGTQGTPDNMFIPGYYGVGSASEAAGLLRYAEETDDIVVKDTVSDTTKTFTREFEFQGAYGMKKD